MTSKSPIFHHPQRAVNMRNSLIISKMKSCTCGLNSIPLCPLRTPFLIFYFSHYTGLDQVLYKHAIASKLFSQMPGFSSSYLFSTLHQNYLSKNVLYHLDSSVPSISSRPFTIMAILLQRHKGANYYLKVAQFPSF